MAFDILPLTDLHLMMLATRPTTGTIDLNDKQGRQILLQGEAFAVTERGEVFGAAGVIPMWKGVGHGWAALAIPTGCKRLVWFTRRVRRFLDECSYRRVQTTVPKEFSRGLAWATHLLTFAPEGILSGYDERGGDHIMMARLRALDDAPDPTHTT